VLCDVAHLLRLAPAVAEGDRWRSLVDAAFRHAFSWLGFGAKTAVGYGAFASTVQTVEAVARLAEPVAPVPSTPAANQSPTVAWDRARLQFNAQNGRLTAFGPGASAYADEPRGAELFARLPAEVRQRVRNNPHSVRVTARVRGSQLIDVEYKA
jgi:CRISPR-associated protein Cmr6